MNEDRTATIKEVLKNAEYNALHGGEYGNTFMTRIASEQAHNARILLEKGYPLSCEVEPLLEKFGDVENVPEYVRES